jgi:hypothetical protein
MFRLAATRFTDATWSENKNYRQTHEIPSIYGVDVPIRNTYNIGEWIFVFEMNNTTNQIEGIGLIQNSLATSTHKIYANYQHNFYVYRGCLWVSKQYIQLFDPHIIEMANTILFKGKSHLKRLNGISIITEKIFRHWKPITLFKLKRRVYKLYLSVYEKTYHRRS